MLDTLLFLRCGNRDVMPGLFLSCLFWLRIKYTVWRHFYRLINFQYELMVIILIKRLIIWPLKWTLTILFLVIYQTSDWPMNVKIVQVQSTELDNWTTANKRNSSPFIMINIYFLVLTIHRKGTCYLLEEFDF